MKTINKTLVAAVAGIALSLFAGPAQAQYKTGSEDGIAASPKLRQRLNEYNRNHSPAPATAEVAKMQCPKCTDQLTTRVDYSARGANKPVIQVVTHQCKDCGVDWKIVGVGKAKTSVATHKCSSCGAENLACCKTGKGSDSATKGME